MPQARESDRAKLERIAYSWCNDFGYELPERYKVWGGDPSTVVWDSANGMIAVITDDDMCPVRVLAPANAD